MKRKLVQICLQMLSAEDKSGPLQGKGSFVAWRRGREWYNAMQ